MDAQYEYHVTHDSTAIDAMVLNVITLPLFAEARGFESR